MEGVSVDGVADLSGLPALRDGDGVEFTHAVPASAVWVDLTIVRSDDPEGEG